MFLISNLFNFFKSINCAQNEVSECTSSLLTINTALNELEGHLEQNFEQDDFMVKEVNSLTTLWTKCLSTEELLELETDHNIKTKNTEKLKEIYATVCKIADKIKSVDFAENIKQQYEQLLSQNVEGSKDEEIEQLKIKIKEISRKLYSSVRKIFKEEKRRKLKENDPMVLLSKYLTEQNENLQLIPLQ